MSKTLLVQYAKWPVLGNVKTRIGKLAGANVALDIHMELVLDVLNRFAKAKELSYQLWLDSFPECFDDFDSKTAWASKILSEEIKVSTIAHFIQEGEDLGERMCHTFSANLKSYEKVAIVGSDCPNVSLQMMREVENALDESDVAIIPAEDGGYVLLAVRTAALAGVATNWLRGVRWGSEEAFSDTLACCERLSLKVSVLAESWDIDELEDYQRWKAKLAELKGTEAKKTSC